MQRKVTLIVASVALLIALWSIWRRINPSLPNQPMLAGVGLVLAEEVVTALHHEGQIVMVTYGDPLQTKLPVSSLVTTFRNELRKHRAISLAAPEIVPANLNENEGLPGCPITVFTRVLQRHADAAAIVFFMDLPDWERAQALISQPVGPKLVALGSQAIQPRSWYAGYFTNGLLSALVFPRRELRPGAPDPKTPRERFDKYYQVVTPQNYESLPD